MRTIATLFAALLALAAGTALAEDTTTTTPGTGIHDQADPVEPTATPSDDDTFDNQSGTENDRSDDTLSDTSFQSGSDEIELSSIKGERAKKLQEKLKAEGCYDGPVDGFIGPLTKAGLEKFQEKNGFEASGKLDMQTAQALGLEMSEIQPVKGSEEPMTTPESEDASTDQQSGDEYLDKGIDEQAGTETDTSATTEDTSVDAQSGTDSTVTGGDTATEETESTTGTENMGGAEISEDPNVVEGGDIETQAGTTNTTVSTDANTIMKVEQALREKNLFTGSADGVMDKQLKKAIKSFQKDNDIPPTGKLDDQTLSKLGVEAQPVLPGRGQDEVKPQSGTEEDDALEGTGNQSGDDTDMKDDEVQPQPETGAPY